MQWAGLAYICCYILWHASPSTRKMGIRAESAECSHIKKIKGSKWENEKKEVF